MSGDVYTGDATVSYPAPTFAAVKGIFECIVWLKSAEVVSPRVENYSPSVLVNEWAYE